MICSNHISFWSTLTTKSLSVRLLLLTLILFTTNFAQAQVEGYLELYGRVKLDGEYVSGVQIKVFRDTTLMKEITTDKKGKYQVLLDFSGDHRVYFSHPASVDIHMELLTSAVPQNKRNIAPGFSAEVILPDKYDRQMNLAMFEKPFTRVVYDGKKGFIDDTDYLTLFAEGLSNKPEVKPDLPVPVAKATPMITIGGRIHVTRDPRNALRFRVIHLLNEKGDTLQTVVTNQNGSFVFNQLPEDANFLISLSDGDDSPPVGLSYTISNRQDWEIAKSSSSSGTQRFEFKRSMRKKVELMRLEEKDIRMDIVGHLLNAKDEPLANVSFQLQNSKGEVLIATTDSNGLFRFVNLLANENFFIANDKAQASLANTDKLFLADAKGKVIREIKLGGSQTFEYHLLEEEKNQLSLFRADDYGMVIAGNLVDAKSGLPLGGRLIKLLDANGEVSETVLANPLGSFVFTRLKGDEAYLISVEEGDAPFPPGSGYLITDKNNREIARAVANQDGKLSFDFPRGDQRLMALEEKPEDLRLGLKGRLKDKSSGRSLNTLKLVLTSNEGKEMFTETGTDGQFEFSELDYKNYYSLALSEPNPALANVDAILLTDERGNVVAEIKVDEDKRFDYQLLPADHFQLGDNYVEDPWVDLLASNEGKAKEFIIRENIYYAVNDYRIGKETKILLDKVVLVMKSNPGINIELSSHTDSRGSDSYNLQLSQKRARTAREYMVSKGIQESRVSFIGYGEKRLLNRCGNGVECSEEEHALNRRVEFKILRQ